MITVTIIRDRALREAGCSAPPSVLDWPLAAGTVLDHVRTIVSEIGCREIWVIHDRDEAATRDATADATSSDAGT
ncbi:MAG TPA: hypothetical protein VNT79_14065, partial [Phycisphaerae bacterium]|nr:hypothetical protein [Phycisphaerae bacterium]